MIMGWPYRGREPLGGPTGSSLALLRLKLSIAEMVDVPITRFAPSR